MAEAVYAIEDFPDDDLLWRIEWIGGVGYNTSVPSDPQIEICLAQLPAGETNPLSARSRSSQTKRTVRIAVGLLPYISIASVWQQRRPVIKDLAASRHRLCIDTSLCRTVALAELANAIPRSSYLFGVSWPDVRRTLLVAVQISWRSFLRFMSIAIVDHLPPQLVARLNAKSSFLAERIPIGTGRGLSMRSRQQILY